MENHLDNYVIYRRLAAALFGDVLLGQHKPTGAYVAMKRVLLSAAAKKKTLVSKKRVRENIALERALYRHFRAIGNHHNVLALRDEIECNGYVYMVSDYCSRGDLYEIVSKAEQGKLSVATARNYITQIARGVQFMHENGYAHRDLSLENVLVTEDDVCKVCDFGLAASTTTKSTETVGKLLYMAPEVLAGMSYDVKKADVWSLGVMLFIMLLGAPPVESATLTDVRFKIISSRGVVNLIHRWNLMDTIPSEAIELLAGMLQADAMNRMTMEQVLHHPFLCPVVRIPLFNQSFLSPIAPTTVVDDRKNGGLADEVTQTASSIKECRVASTFQRLFRRSSKRRIMAVSSQQTKNIMI